MTKYPCANSRCTRDVPTPGLYCPRCQIKIQEFIKQETEDRQKQINRERYQKHHPKQKEQE